MRNGTAVKINLTLIRHGETCSNAEHRYLGKTEEELSEAGREALLKKKAEGRYPSCELLFSSPMKRCLQTAEIVFPNQKPICIPEWKEIDFGRFEGKNYKELSGDADYQRWIDSNGTLPFPEGESREAFIGRSLRGFERMLGRLPKGRSEYMAVLVVHGGTMMALLSAWNLGEYYDFQAKNGEGYVVSLLADAGETKVLELKKL